MQPQAAKELTSAIMVQMVKDYRKAYKSMLNKYGIDFPTKEISEKDLYRLDRISEIQRFCKGNLCELYLAILYQDAETEITGTDILHSLERETINEYIQEQAKLTEQAELSA